MKRIKKIMLTLIFSMIPSIGFSSDFLNLKEDDYVIKKFNFHDGSVIENLKIHYTTIGNPQGQAVLILHDTAEDGKSMLDDSFGKELFDKGMPLDAKKYFIILPDAIGTGGSSKPSDELKGKFPHYDYSDIVNAQYQLLKNGLGIDHLYLIIGNSMGGMCTWNWVTMYPGYMTGAIPLAATPAPMSSRNWIMRKMVINAIRNDPDWQNGFYEKQPEQFQTVLNYYNIATNGGDIAWQVLAYNTERSEEILNNRLQQRITMDANDFLYQLDAARTFDPTIDLKEIKAYILAINSADDERNPPSTNLMDKIIKKIPTAKYYLIPANIKTSGHGTTMSVDLWKKQLVDFLNEISSKN